MSHLPCHVSIWWACSCKTKCLPNAYILGFWKHLLLIFTVNVVFDSWPNFTVFAKQDVMDINILAPYKTRFLRYKFTRSFMNQGRLYFTTVDFRMFIMKNYNGFTIDFRLQECESTTRDEWGNKGRWKPSLSQHKAMHFMKFLKANYQPTTIIKTRKLVQHLVACKIIFLLARNWQYILWLGDEILLSLLFSHVTWEWG